MKTNLLLILVLLGFHIPTAYAQKAFTLEEAVNYAISNSPQLKLKQLDVADAEGQILEYKSIGIPKVNGKIEYQYFINIPTSIFPDFISPSVYEVLFSEELLERRDIDFGAGFPARFGTNNNLTASISASGLIFDGSFLVGLKAQKLFKNLIQKQINQSKYEIETAVTKAYLPILIAKKNIEILDKNVDNLNSLLYGTKLTYENGLAEKLDVERIELTLENLAVEREKINRTIDILLNALKFQMGYPLNEILNVKDDLDTLVAIAITAAAEADQEINYNNRPEYAVIQTGEELNEINLRRLKAGYLPNVVGFASYQQALQRNKLFDGDENGWFPTTVVGLTVNVPIFDGFEKKAKMQRAQIELEKTQIQKREFERGMRLQIENAKINFLNAQQTVADRKKTVALAQKIYDTTQIKYKEGVGSSLELNIAERDLYTTQANYVNALYDLLVAKTDLDIAKGE